MLNDIVIKPIIDKYFPNDSINCDFFIAIERGAFGETEKRVTTLSFIDTFLREFETYIKGRNFENFKRITVVSDRKTAEDSLKNNFYAIVIKTPRYDKADPNSPKPNANNNIVDGDDGYYYDITNLITYLTIADSRTYKNEITCYQNIIFRAEAEEKKPEVNVDWPHNMLIHGAPGTGKSSMVDDKAKKEFFPKNVHRVTFYEDYSYEIFVGAYMPVSEDKTTTIIYGDKKKGKLQSQAIAYKFKPGIMAIVLADAYAALLNAIVKNVDVQKPVEINYDSLFYADNPERFLLIIEEINRAPAASVLAIFSNCLTENRTEKALIRLTLRKNSRSGL